MVQLEFPTYSLSFNSLWCNYQDVDKGKDTTFYQIGKTEGMFTNIIKNFLGFSISLYCRSFAIANKEVRHGDCLDGLLH